VDTPRLVLTNRELLRIHEMAVQLLIGSNLTRSADERPLQLIYIIEALGVYLQHKGIEPPWELDYDD